MKDKFYEVNKFELKDDVPYYDGKPLTISKNSQGYSRVYINKKAQNTAEYAILIALVIGAVVAMQTYAQRALQGRMRDASLQLVQQTSNLGTTAQYEPYYLNTRSQLETDVRDVDTADAVTRSKVVTKGMASVDRTDYKNGAVDTSGVLGLNSTIEGL